MYNLSLRYAIRLAFTSFDHPLRSLNGPDPAEFAASAGNARSLSGIRYSFSLLSQILSPDAFLEDRSSCGPSVSFPTHFPSLSADDDCLVSHRSFLSSLHTDTLVLYSDGFRLEDGYCGTGWLLTTAERALDADHPFSSSGCHFGPTCEVFDAELHAISEGLSFIASRYLPGNLVVFADNQAALLDIQACNLSRGEFCRSILTLLKAREDLGLSSRGVWVPSHVGIAGNETVDRIAKRFASAHNSLCAHSRTIRTHLQAKARSSLLASWSSSFPPPEGFNIVPSLSVPNPLRSVGFRVSRGYFRCLTSTAPQDSFPWDPPPAVCQCGTGSVSSSHFIRNCPLLSNLRPSVPPDELLY